MDERSGRELRVTDERQRQRFMDVVIPHLDDAQSLARWLTGNAADAEDVVQDAAIRALAGIGSLREGNPRAWLLTIVRNTAFTWLAKNRPKQLIVTDDDRVFEQAGLAMDEALGTPTPEAALIAKADAQCVTAAIAALPLPYREVIVLREIEELSYQEIARVTSLPIGTVMSRLSRARVKLMAAIAADPAYRGQSVKAGRV